MRMSLLLPSRRNSAWVATWVACSFFVFSAISQDSGAENTANTNRFSGKTVADLQHALSLINYRYPRSIGVGDTAPDLHVSDRETQESLGWDDLLGEKPVVLIFGSLSCSSINLYLQDLPALAKTYQDRFDFYFIYLREAHPHGGFQPNLQAGVAEAGNPVVIDPQDLDERSDLAKTMEEEKQLGMPVLVDSMMDSSAVAWSAWPARIFVVSTDKKVVYAGGQAPWYFDATKDGWHEEPPLDLEQFFAQKPFSRISLEEFLESSSVRGR